jgi:hypothetical protein
VGWASKGATWGIRTIRAGLQQAAITGAVDPAVQALNIEAGVQESYDPLRTAVAAATGFGIGGGAHAAGEGLERLVGQQMLRRQLADLAAQDASFASMRTAQEALNPDSAVPAAPAARGAEETLAPAAPARAAEVSPGPSHSYQDTVARIKQEGQEADRTANQAARERGEVPKAKQPGERDVDARTAAVEEEIGPQIRSLSEEHGLSPDDINDISRLYDRQAGEHPQTAFERAVDEWAAANEAEAIRVFEGTDSRLVAELAEIERAFQADLARESPAGTGKFRPDEQRFTASPGLIHERGIGDIPFEGQGETRPAGGRPAEPGGREVPGAEGRAAEGGASAPGGGERARSQPAAEGAASDRIVDLVERIERRKRQTAGTKGDEPVPHEEVLQEIANEVPGLTDRQLDGLHAYIEEGNLGSPNETKALYDLIQTD